MDALIEKTSGTDTPVDRKNKWRSYRDGNHTPSTALVKAIEPKFPGSLAVLSHPVWQLLRLDRLVQVEIPSLLSQLPPSDFTVVLSGSADSHSGLALASDWDARRLRKLERQTGLDALAYLIALLRKAVESGETRQAESHQRGGGRSLEAAEPFRRRGSLPLSWVPNLGRAMKFFCKALGPLLGNLPRYRRIS